MKTFFLLVMLCGLVQWTFAATTITYSYDRQHRLVRADYTEAQADAVAMYQYDAANNLDVEVVVTEPGMLKSFLLWLSSVWTDLWSRSAA